MTGQVYPLADYRRRKTRETNRDVPEMPLGWSGPTPVKQEEKKRNDGKDQTNNIHSDLLVVTYLPNWRKNHPQRHTVRS